MEHTADTYADGRTGLRLFTFARVSSVAIALVAMTTGYRGLWLYVRAPQVRDEQLGRKWWDILYYDLQLFVLGSRPLEGPPPFNIWLDIGRYTAAAATVYALVLAGSRLLADTLRRRKSHHTIVVGTTAEAQAIVARLREKGSLRGMAGIRWLAGLRGRRGGRGRRGTKVLQVDTGDPLTLSSVRVGRATALYACVADTETSAANVAIALAAADLRRRRRGGGLREEFHVYAHISDARLRRSLQAQSYLRLEPDRLYVDFFNVDELAGRHCVAADAIDITAIGHILVVGTSAFGQAVVVELAQQWRDGHSPGKRIPVTLVGPDAQAVKDELVLHWAAVTHHCQLTAIDLPDLRDLHDLEAALPWVRTTAPYRSYFCMDDEDLALRLGIAAAVAWLGGQSSVVVRLNRSGLANRSAGTRGAASNPGLRGQDLLDDVGGRLRLVTAVDLAAEHLLGESYLVERLARSAHQSYLNRQLERGVRRGSTEAMVEWQALAESYRQDNRAQVRDLPRKLRLISCTVVPSSDHVPRFRLRSEEVEQLAEAEHDRWVTRRRANGWRYGKRRSEWFKRHPSLVPWGDLDDEEREKDRDIARRIGSDLAPALLDAGLEIVRV